MTHMAKYIEQTTHLIVCSCGEKFEFMAELERHIAATK